MDSLLIAIVEKLAKEQGANALLDLTRCKSLLNDYAKNEYKKERHLLLLAIESGAAKEIANAVDLTIAKKVQIRTLKDDRFIDETAASEVIDLLGLVLRGDRSVSAGVQSTQRKQQSQQPKQSNKTPPAQPVKPDPSKAKACYERGELYKNRKDYLTAIVEYTQAIGFDPNYSSAYFCRGYSYAEVGDHSKAIRD